VPIKKIWGLIASTAACVAMFVPATSAFAAAETPPPVPPLDEATCAHQDLTQALLPFGDTNLYTLSPGGAFANATDWQLAGGATITSSVQPDGVAGGVLQLPGKSQATSPVMCITADYPMARLWVRNVYEDEDVRFNVQYWDAEKLEWTKPKENGKFKAAKDGLWALSKELDIKPDHEEGWQQVRFTLRPLHPARAGRSEEAPRPGRQPLDRSASEQVAA
jgi:hypothetical protein